MLLLLLISLEFVRYAIQLGWNGFATGLPGHRLVAASGAANFGLFAHMIAGAVITALAPIQLLPFMRRRWPQVHRWAGRVLVGFAGVAGLGGLVYIALNGTVGGHQMNIAFAVYGALVVLCAVQTLRFARARKLRDHRDWAVRLFFLCIASLLYRIHYGLWDLATDGAGVSGLEAGMSGWFDRINNWAFYVPYLLAVEIALWRQGRGLFAAGAKL